MIFIFVVLEYLAGRRFVNPRALLDRQARGSGAESRRSGGTAGGVRAGAQPTGAYSRREATVSDIRLVEAWQASAQPWTATVRERRIGSRVRVTDAAVLSAVLSRSPASVLDIGCGEGWLARELAGHGVRVTGVDAVPALVEQARLAGGGDFRVATYEDLAAGKLEQQFDLAVANFALLGQHPVEALVLRMEHLLVPGGALVVQTVHPWAGTGDAPYADGWREGSWDGFGPDFSVAPPFYFRTTQSWIALLVAGRLRIVEILEPVDPLLGRPASILFLAERQR
jgi:2-polyprenyl-3-methyl-5-hydroxy-6-metoxy-1,4-benzoquinol methylase